MKKLSNIKNDSISVNYFLNSAAYSGLFSLFLVILFLDLALLGLGLSLVNFALRGHILATVKDKKISGYFIFFSDNDGQSWIRNWSFGFELYI